MSMHPGYVFKGKTYKSLTGLMNALQKDSTAASIKFPSSTLAITENRNADGSWREAGRYSMTPPKAGEQQRVERVSLASA